MTTPASAADRASTARHFRVRASINGIDLGEFDKRTGGRTAAENAKHTPASAPSKRVALGGPRDTDGVMVDRAFVATRDHDLIRRFRPLCGLAEMSVTQTPLDKDGREYGRPEQWTGVLESIGPPEYDSESSEVARFEITMTADGDVA
ncbi:MAG: hypothetical protein JWO69_2003 [Thermoleophilia bacterium]|nr:hypothetical protein [Thermoleophilia bacterium]